MNAESRRMLWRCRRGLLELDIVLERFVEQHFSSLTKAQLQTFDTLLDYTDNELWDLLVHRNETDEAQLQEVLGMLRGACARFEERGAAGHGH